jgi:hypothetical protein
MRRQKQNTRKKMDVCFPKFNSFMLAPKFFALFWHHFFEAHTKCATMLSLTLALFHGPKWAKWRIFSPTNPNRCHDFHAPPREGPRQKRAKIYSASMKLLF